MIAPSPRTAPGSPEHPLERNYQRSKGAEPCWRPCLRCGGKNLACWRPLPGHGESDICHAALLLELANRSRATAK
jgi:hypothetical protein